MRHYILGPNGEPKEASAMEWAEWYESHPDERIVVQHTLLSGVKVSTVFLGLDHNFSGVGPPLIYETMIFGGQHDQHQERCSTLDEAYEQHDRAMQLAKEPGSTNK